MRMSRLFSQTLRDAPAEAEIASHQLLLRAGFIRQLGAGIFSVLPLARRSLTKIEAIVRQEMDAIDGQEITMPVVHPADVWKESRRWYAIGPEMARFQDRAGRDMVLAMTHEEIVADLVRKEVHSYRQLPLMVYHIQTKFRDEPRPRAGLIRVREFTMKDSYSLDADWDGLDKQYRAHYQAYFNIYHRCDLPVIAVKSDVGMMGGSLAHEFMFLTPVGEDTLLLCDECGYKANREVATFRKPESPQAAMLPLEKVATPDSQTIQAVADYLGVPKSQTAKAVFMMATVAEGEAQTEKFVFAVVRGDMEVNEIKLANVVKAKALRPATEEEISAIGAVPGYASPIGIQREDALVVVDDAIPNAPNLVSGANEAGYHVKNANYGRDYTADIVADIVTAQDGDPCPNCGAPLHTVRGIEVGNIFKLGTRYSEALDATYLDRDGQEKPVVMGSYGIGIGRLLASVAEAHHDDNGLIWPVAIAPYHVYIVVMPGGEEQAEQIYADLTQNGVEVLLDDRDERAGVKFNDADLIGIPLRLTISKRSLESGGVEFKRRDQDDKRIIPLADVVSAIQSEIAALQAEIDHTVVDVPFAE